MWDIDLSPQGNCNPFEEIRNDLIKRIWGGASVSRAEKEKESFLKVDLIQAAFMEEAEVISL